MATLEVEDFYDLSVPSQVAVSPDGDRVAFVVTESDPDEDRRRNSLFVVPADGSREPHRLTRASDAGGPKWSPDGDRLAFVAARETDLARTVGREDDEDDEETDADTEEDTEDDDSGNGNGSGGPPGDDEPKPQVWLFDLALGGDAVQVTDFEEGVREFDWGPSGDRVVVSARDPTDDQRERLQERRDGGPIEVERLQHKANGTGWLDDVRSYLFVVDVEDGDAERLDVAYGQGAREPIFGLQPAWGSGDRIAFASNRTDRPDDSGVMDLYTVSPDGSNLRKLTDSDVRSYFYEWSPDGSRVAFVGGDPDNWYRPAELYVCDPGDPEADPGAPIDADTADADTADAGDADPDGDADADTADGEADGDGSGDADEGDGTDDAGKADDESEDGDGPHLPDPDPGGETAELWSVTASLDRTVSGFGSPSWVDAGTLVAPVGDRGLTRLVRAPADRDDPDRVFEAQGRDRTMQFPDCAGGTVATVLSDPREGVDVHAVDVADLDDPDASVRRLSALNDDLLDVDLGDCRRVTVENGDGVAVESIVHLPPGFDPEADDGSGDDPVPVVASIHGGPMSYDAPEFRFLYAYWAGQGYAVVRPNYRGSTSYGREYAERLMGTRGDLETDDVLSTVEQLADRGWVDMDRSLVTGFSYGGITTANVVTRSDEFAAAAAEHGVYDFRSSFGTDDNHLWHDWEFGLPWEEPETYEEISSITDVDRVETPLLVTAGENDWRCPPTQAEQLYVSVRKRGVDAKLVIYQNEHHNVGDPDRAIHRIEALTDWFERHALDGPVGDEIDGDDPGDDASERGRDA